MSRKHSDRKRKPVEWTASELEELKGLKNPDADQLIGNFDKSECIILVRCFRVLAKERGEIEECEFYNQFLDYFDVSPEPQLRDWKVFASLIYKNPVFS